MKSTTIAALLLIAGGVLLAVQKPKEDTSVVTPDPPSAALQAIVEPVAKTFRERKAAGQADATKAKAAAEAAQDGVALAKMYRALADEIERDKGRVLTTTAVLQETHVRAGKLRFQETGIDGRYPGLFDAVNKALESQLGLKAVPLDTEKQRAAADAFKALAWACEGGGQ